MRCPERVKSGVMWCSTYQCIETVEDAAARICREAIEEEGQ
jgi:hypothetical protein